MQERLAKERGNYTGTIERYKDIIRTSLDHLPFLFNIRTTIKIDIGYVQRFKAFMYQFWRFWSRFPFRHFSKYIGITRKSQSGIKTTLYSPQMCHKLGGNIGGILPSIDAPFVTLSPHFFWPLSIMNLINLCLQHSFSNSQPIFLMDIFIFVG